MIRSIPCLIFILAHSVMAQAAENGTARIAPQKWIATHSGETEMYGLPITAVLESQAPGLGIPDVRAGLGNTLLPSVQPEAKNTYRLTFLVSHNPGARSIFPLRPSNATLDGKIRFGYLSEISSQQDFTFFVTENSDGSLRVSFHRNAPSEGGADHGEFTLLPVPHIL